MIPPIQREILFEALNWWFNKQTLRSEVPFHQTMKARAFFSLKKRLHKIAEGQTTERKAFMRASLGPLAEKMYPGDKGAQKIALLMLEAGWLAADANPEPRTEEVEE